MFLACFAQICGTLVLQRGLLCGFLHHRYLDGRIFIIDVLPQSQAEVDEVVLVGDVIDEINGFSLRNACNGQVCGRGTL